MGGCGTKSVQFAKQTGKGHDKEDPQRPASVKTGRPPSESHGPRIVLGKYRMASGKEDIMGKGTSSICRRGVEVASGKPVAIKLYKEQQTGGRVKETTLQKFRRQIAVLKELMEPFPPPTDASMWSEVLANIKPAQVFMQLIDYSKGPNGQPGPDPADGMLYVVTELAQYSLKDFLADRRERQKPLSKETVRDLCKRMLLAMAALHAKGFVHIDMKPENMMVFDGRLKVIDVDGCVRTGTKVSINDGSISFSPCYCAPEWARFMVKDSEPSIVATPALDVWSIGMTLCELVALDAIWKPQYANFLRNAHSNREAGFLFLEWLGDIKRPPLPKSIDKFEPAFLELLLQWLLVCSPKHRRTCAECLSSPYLAEGGWAKYGEAKEAPPAAEAVPERVQRDRPEDDSTLAPLHKGTLWKLNANGSPQEISHWIKRDMWLAHNHSLCYYSVKENKRLVLLDGEKLSSADVNVVAGTAKEFAIEIKSREGADEKFDKVSLGCDSKEDMDTWMAKLAKTATMDMMVTFRLGDRMAQDIQAFKLAVRNRRMKVEGDKDAFEPMFKGILWKLKSQGDQTKEEHWFQRDMWIAKNGSFVYYSPKEERELVYYTAADIARAKVAKVQDGKACRENVFSVQLSPAGGVEFEPGEFAAESPELRDEWITELSKFM